jgi:signal transduction histidine kinase
LFYRVSDTGIGIRESQLNQLFSRFSQLDMSSTRQYHGSGLGLAISKELVRRGRRVGEGDGRRESGRVGGGRREKKSFLLTRKR